MGKRTTKALSIRRRVVRGVTAAALFSLGAGLAVHQAQASAPPAKTPAHAVTVPAKPVAKPTGPLAALDALNSKGVLQNLSLLGRTSFGPTNQSEGGSGTPYMTSATSSLLDQINRAVGTTGDMVDRTMNGQPLTPDEERSGAAALKYGTSYLDLTENLMNNYTRMDHENLNEWEYLTYGPTQTDSSGNTWYRDSTSGTWSSPTDPGNSTPPFFYSDVNSMP